MKTLFCYGDSNMWGQKPSVWEQHPEDLIWTNLLAQKLDLKVKAEGLCGRTAGDIDLEKPFHNGCSHFLSHAYSNWPFDSVLISLGTNDLQSRFKRTAQNIFEDLINYKKHLEFMRVDDGIDNLNLYFMTPPMLAQNIGVGEAFQDADKKILELRGLLRENQKRLGYYLIDITEIIVSSEDSLHFTVGEHLQVAEIVANKISCRFVN